jgi:hypothetical protein
VEVRSPMYHEESDYGPISSFKNSFKYKSKRDDVMIGMSIVDI